jgi:tetratricopeptide (TPR) repeat protein
VLFAHERFADATTALERALALRAPGAGAGDDLELRSLLGRAALRVGRRDQARLHLEAALRLDAEHSPSLAAMLELGDLPAEREIACRRALVRQLPAEARFDHIVRIGERFLDDFDDVSSALAAWRAALDLRPEDHRLLHRCLDALVDRRQWHAAVDVLDRLIAIERVPARRARYRAAAATIARDELASPDVAIRYLTGAVDDDPTHERAVRAFERLLEAQERWRDLERHYARALERLGPEAPDGRNAERMRLWSALARLCLARPELRSDAAVAFDVAERVKQRSEERLDTKVGTS